MAVPQVRFGPLYHQHTETRSKKTAEQWHDFILVTNSLWKTGYKAGNSDRIRSSRNEQPEVLSGDALTAAIEFPNQSLSSSSNSCARKSGNIDQNIDWGGGTNISGFRKPASL
jgi:hypothetical protein